MKLSVAVTRIDHGMDAFKKRLQLLAMKKSYVKAGVLGGQHKNDGTGHHAHETDHKRDSAGRYTKPIVEREGELTNAQLASIHEFGLGNAPARPFVRPPFVQHRSEYLELLRAGYRDAFTKNDPNAFRRVLGLVGQKMAADIKAYVTQGNNLAPLAQSTIDRKGSSRPLVDTGQMVNSISYAVVDNGGEGGGHEH